MPHLTATTANGPRAKPEKTGLSLTAAIDIGGAVAVVCLALYGFGSPNDPLLLPAFATAFCSWLALRVTAEVGCGGRWWPAPGLMFLLLMLIMNHVGGFYYYRVPLLSPPSAALTMIWGGNVAYLGFAAGTWIYGRSTRLNIKTMIDGFYARPLLLPSSHHRLLLPCLIIFAVGVAGTMVLMGGKLPLQDVIGTFLQGDFFGVRLMAREARAGLVSDAERPVQGFLLQFQNAVVPMMALLWYTTWRISRRKLYFWLWAASLPVTVALLAGGLQRGPLMLFMLQVILVGVMLYPTRPSVKWLYAAGGIFVVLVILSLLLGRGAQAGGLLPNVKRQAELAAFRLYGSNSLTAVKVFELFPQQMEFRYGETWMTSLRGLLPGPDVTISREIFQSLGRTGKGGAGVNFIAEMWINGGWLMITLVSTLTGAFLQWLNVKWMALPERTPLKLVLMAMVFFCASLLGWGGLLMPVNQGLIAFVGLAWILHRLLSRDRSRTLVSAIQSGSAIAGAS